MLSLVLQTNQWNEINERKQQKAINKLSKFFAVPKVNNSEFMFFVIVYI